jgi:1-acyl-sn-glycerol-3-phosphate acyltransferase
MTQATLLMRFCSFVLRLFGWQVVRNLPPKNKYIVVGAWHTSNWDFPLAVLAAGAMGLKLNFIGKQELTQGKLRWLMKGLGVIGVDRSQRNQFVQKVAQLFEDSQELRIVVPAEGTRSKSEYWRTGFYYMALAAKVPIAFGFIDSVKKQIGINGYFVPSGNRDEDLQKVIDFFKNKKGLKPHKQGVPVFRPLEPQEEVQGDSRLKIKDSRF